MPNRLLRPRNATNHTLLPVRAPSRAFHSTRPQKQDDHYATLELPPDASQSDIKKQFYTLSKAHHPDHNPQDPDTASKKFVAISSAYATLGNPTKRQKYDAEMFGRGASSGQGSRGGASSGSYSSASGYAPGGRKASGLSKRRNQFRGPPPSFYRSGGWGANAGKREANMGRDARDFDAQQQQQQNGSASGSSGASAGFAGGSSAAADGTSSWPFHTDPNDVAHFDRERHYKTQTTVEDQLRQGRMKRRAVQNRGREGERQRDDGSDLGRFVWVFGVLAVGVAVVPIWSAAR